MNRIVIVGASAGGLSTADALRRMGHQGEITLIGDESHAPYDRPPLSKQYLSGEWNIDQLPLREPVDLQVLDLDLCLGASATGLDQARQTVSVADGDSVPYDQLVIATGVRPRRLSGTADLAGVYTLRTLDDATALRARLLTGRRLVVIGGGFLGMEVAATATELGVEVTVLESAPVPLRYAVGEEVGSVLVRCHQEHGVDVRTGITVAGLTAAHGEVSGVQLDDGELIPADTVLVAVGSTPNTEWLSGSGLAVSDGVVCDEYLAAAPGVYAVGDVARWHNPLFDVSMRIEHRTHAGESALTVAHNMVNPDSRRALAAIPYFWSDQYGMKIQAYGYLRGHDEAVVLEGDLATRRFLVGYRKADRLTGVLAVGMPPKTLRTWRTLVRDATEWDDARAMCRTRMSASAHG